MLWISDARPADSHRRRALAEAADHLRCQHAFDGAETQRRRLRAQDHHGENAVPLGTGHRHGQGGERATVARLLAESGSALERRCRRRARSRASPPRPRSRLSPATIADKSAKIADRSIFRGPRDALEAAIAAEGFSRETFDSAFVLLDQLQGRRRSRRARCPIGGRSCRKHPAGGFWSIVISPTIRF